MYDVNYVRLLTIYRPLLLCLPYGHMLPFIGHEKYLVEAGAGINRYKSVRRR